MSTPTFATEISPPMAVRVLDVENEPRALRVTRGAGEPYHSVLMIVRQASRPVDMRVVSLEPQGLLSADSIERLSAPWRGDRSRDSEAEMRRLAKPDALVSVVVATCAGEAAPLRCVKSVLGGEHRNVEVLVVDNRPAASATSAALDKGFGDDVRVRYVPEPRVGLSYVRNTGISHARGDIVVFTDDDSVADAGWLSAIVAAFTPEVSCVTGLIVPLSIETPAQAVFERFAGLNKGLDRRVFELGQDADDPLFPYAAGSFGSGANTAILRSAALSAGGYDVQLGTGTWACGGEDLDMYIRLLLGGHRLVYEPAAILFHEHPARAAAIRRRAFRYGVGLTAMLTKHLLGSSRRRLLRAVPSGVGYLVRPGSRKNVSRGPGYPKILSLLEGCGMVAGPVAFALSAHEARRRLAPSEVSP